MTYINIYFLSLQLRFTVLSFITCYLIHQAPLTVMYCTGTGKDINRLLCAYNYIIVSCNVYCMLVINANFLLGINKVLI